jgi:hypothetical protein
VQAEELKRLDRPNQADGRGDRRNLRQGHGAKDLPEARPIEGSGLDLFSRLAFQRRQHDQEYEGDPLPGIAHHHHGARRPGGRGPTEIAEAEETPDGRERPLGHVRQHAEGIGHPHRRHHQRDEEDDAEEAAGRDLLGAEQSQTQTDHELRRDADGDIEHGDAEGAELAPRPQGRGKEQEDRQQQGCPDQPAQNSRRRDPPIPQISHQAAQQEPRPRRQQQPAVPGHRREDAEEMKLLAAEEQLLEIEPADIAQPIAAGHELEAGERQIC